MSEQIKPCPFCGHVGLDFEEGSTFRWILPNCAGCGATRGEVRIQTLGDGTRMEWLDAAKADAIKAWNTRATQPQAPQGGGDCRKITFASDCFVNGVFIKAGTEINFLPAPTETPKGQL